MLQELLEHSINEDLKVKFKGGYHIFWLQAEMPKEDWTEGNCGKGFDSVSLIISLKSSSAVANL
nr:unnamed protein product [Callosobruchus analis]